MVDKTTRLRKKTISAVAGTPLEHDLGDRAQSLLKFLPLSNSGSPFKAEMRTDKTGRTLAGKPGKSGAKSAARLNAPGNRLAMGRVVGAPRAAIFLEKATGPAAEEVKRLKFALSPNVDLVTLGTPVSPKAEAGVDLPGLLIEDWRPGRSVGHVDGAAGTLGVFVEFKAKRGAGLQALKGFATASHVLTLNVTARNGSEILSPAPPDVKRDPGSYFAGYLRSWCKLVHYAESHATAQGNETDIAFVELDDPVNFPTRNNVPAPSDPESDFLELTEVASREDVAKYKLNTRVHKFGRTTGFTSGILHSALAPFTIRLTDGKSYLYANLYFVRPEDTATGFSAGGDSGAPVYTKDGILVGFVVGQANGGSLMQLAQPCLDFANAKLAGS